MIASSRYINLREYLLTRGLEHLARLVPWPDKDEKLDEAEDKGKPSTPVKRTKNFINILKIRLGWHYPEKMRGDFAQRGSCSLDVLNVVRVAGTVPGESCRSHHWSCWVCIGALAEYGWSGCWHSHVESGAVGLVCAGASRSIGGLDG